MIAQDSLSGSCPKHKYFPSLELIAQARYLCGLIRSGGLRITILRANDFLSIIPQMVS
jgi:hypothetical protein